MDNKTWSELSLSFKSTSKYADKRTLVITKPYGSFWKCAVAGSISAFLLVINAESHWRRGSQRAHFNIKMIPLNCCLPLISIFHLPPNLLGFKSCRSEISRSSVLKGTLKTQIQVESTVGQVALWGNLLERRLWRMRPLLIQTLTSNSFRPQLES